MRPLLALFMLSVLLTGLVAGCGGGDQSGNGGEEKQQAGKDAEQGGGASKVEESDKKIALGTIQTVEEDKRKISVKLAAEVRGKKQLAFKVNKRTDIAFGGEKAEIGDITEGQQAKIEYVDRDKGPGRAVNVELFEVQRREPSEEGEKTN